MILLQRGNVLRSFIKFFKSSRDYISTVYKASVPLETLTFVFAHCSELLKVAGVSGDSLLQFPCTRLGQQKWIALFGCVLSISRDGDFQLLWVPVPLLDHLHRKKTNKTRPKEAYVCVFQFLATISCPFSSYLRRA